MRCHTCSAAFSLIEILARVSAQEDDAEQAITTLQKVLALPYEGLLGGGQAPLTAALLRLDPVFDPLRADPRLQKLGNQIKD